MGEYAMGHHASTRELLMGVIALMGNVVLGQYLRMTLSSTDVSLEPPPMPMPPVPNVSDHCDADVLLHECADNDTGLGWIWNDDFRERMDIAGHVGCDPTGCLAFGEAYWKICPKVCGWCGRVSSCADDNATADAFWRKMLDTDTMITALSCARLKDLERGPYPWLLKGNVLEACCPRESGRCGGSGATAWMIMLGISGGIISVCVLCCCTCYCRARQKRSREYSCSDVSVASDVSLLADSCVSVGESGLVKEHLQSAVITRRDTRVSRTPESRSPSARTRTASSSSGVMPLSSNCEDEIGMLQDRRQNLQEEGDARNSFAESSMVQTVSLLTEDLFNRTKMYGIMKLGVYEHWMIKPQDIQVEARSRGHGTYGMVQRGLLYGGTDIAVKVAMSVNREQGLFSLANEVRLLRRIRHQNIVLFYGVLIDREEFNLSLVLEWIEGANMEQYTKDMRNLALHENDKDTAELVRFAHGRKLICDTARAMQYLHAHVPLILHRDLKPSNILVETSMTPPRAKIADFGLSVLVKGTGRTERAGTLEYMAPEVQRSELYSAGADVWSFGCVALFVWACRHPSPEAYEALCAELVGSRDMQALAMVARRCLQPQPSDRPAFSAILRSLQLTEWPQNTKDSEGSEITRLGSDPVSATPHTSLVSHETFEPVPEEPEACAPDTEATRDHTEPCARTSPGATQDATEP